MSKYWKIKYFPEKCNTRVYAKTNMHFCFASFSKEVSFCDHLHIVLMMEVDFDIRFNVHGRMTLITTIKTNALIDVRKQMFIGNYSFYWIVHQVVKPSEELC